jgi:tRNA threonylcarbamoyladenosine biosynthesis protein TsaB
MLILGVDTSGKNGSIALAQCEVDGSHTIEVVPLEGGTFSAQLIPQISTLLAKHGLSKENIDAFAVASGPGSFTGLRVGLAAIKALAEILHRPIVAISLLEVVALEVRIQGRVTAALDAGRGEIYVAEYEIHRTTAKLLVQELLSNAESLGRFISSALATPDPKITELAAAQNIAVIRTDPVRADRIAALGFRKLQSGESVSPEALDANYIRRSDAEVVRSSKRPK